MSVDDNNTGERMMRRLSGLAVLAMLLQATVAGAQPAAWKPERNVEIIVGTAPGAAPDRTARLIQKIWQGQRI
jgi:tripartite-type tricarboxylate transporter receptor subunit TctC